MGIRILTMGDCAFTVEYSDLAGAQGAKHVRALRLQLQQHIESGTLAGIIDVVSATRSLTICIDPLIADIEALKAHVQTLAQMPHDTNQASGVEWMLPACYQGDYAPDLAEVAERSNMSAEEVISLHSQLTYDVLLIGFLPGFPFMSEISTKLRFPRRTNPRTKVPAGSVAIANNQTAIYPWESPGGWHILARCPVPLFNPNWTQPSLLAPGDQVTFNPISREAYTQLVTGLKDRSIDPQSFVKSKEIQS